jgi:hypothetical protein
MITLHPGKQCSKNRPIRRLIMHLIAARWVTVSNKPNRVSYSSGRFNRPDKRLNGLCRSVSPAQQTKICLLPRPTASSPHALCRQISDSTHRRPMLASGGSISHFPHGAGLHAKQAAPPVPPRRGAGGGRLELLFRLVQLLSALGFFVCCTHCCSRN